MDAAIKTGGPGGAYTPPTFTVESVGGEERSHEPEPIATQTSSEPDLEKAGPTDLSPSFTAHGGADPPNLAGLDPNTPSIDTETSGDLFQQGESLLSGGGAKAVTPRDFFFAMLFHICAGICVVFFLVFHVIGVGAEESAAMPRVGGILGRGVGTALFASATIAFCIAVVWLAILNVAAKWMIKVSIVFALCASLATAILGFAKGWYLMGLVMLVLVGLQIMWFSSIWARADLAATIIGVTVTFTSIYPAVYAVAAGSLLAQFIWLWVWSKAATSTILYFGGSSSLGRFLIVYFVGMLFWGIQVLKNIVHVTTCGTFAQWYFRYPHNHESIQPTVNSLQKSCTTSFGSVALGSLLVAVVRSLRVLMNLFCKNWSSMPPFLSLACRYCFVAIEKLTSYFNVYAFVHVALYQRSYFEAARCTCDIVKVAGVDALINDEFVDVALTMGATCGGIACGFFPAMIGQAQEDGLSPTQAGVVMVLGSILGYTIIMGVLTVVWSCVVTLFVCFAEDAQSLYRTKPEVFHALVNAWQQRFHVRLTVDEALDESMPNVLPVGVHTIDDCEDPKLEQHSSLLGHQANAVSIDKERGYQID